MQGRSCAQEPRAPRCERGGERSCSYAIDLCEHKSIRLPAVSRSLCARAVLASSHAGSLHTRSFLPLIASLNQPPPIACYSICSMHVAHTHTRNTCGRANPKCLIDNRESATSKTSGSADRLAASIHRHWPSGRQPSMRLYGYQLVGV